MSLIQDYFIDKTIDYVKPIGISRNYFALSRHITFRNKDIIGFIIYKSDGDMWFMYKNIIYKNNQKVWLRNPLIYANYLFIPVTNFIIPNFTKIKFDNNIDMINYIMQKEFSNKITSFKDILKKYYNNQLDYVKQRINSYVKGSKILFREDMSNNLRVHFDFRIPIKSKLKSFVFNDYMQNMDGRKIIETNPHSMKFLVFHGVISYGYGMGELELYDVGHCEIYNKYPLEFSISGKRYNYKYVKFIKLKYKNFWLVDIE